MNTDEHEIKYVFFCRTTLRQQIKWLSIKQKESQIRATEFRANEHQRPLYVSVNCIEMWNDLELN